MISFVSRNLKVFFRDKTAVFFSLLAVLIVLGLYIFFLGDVWIDSFPNIKGVKNLMNCWIIAGLIGVTSVTANMGAFGTMIEDKSKNKNKRFLCIADKKIENSRRIYYKLFYSWKYDVSSDADNITNLFSI